jgi:hypothetical protein
MIGPGSAFDDGAIGHGRYRIGSVDRRLVLGPIQIREKNENDKCSSNIFRKDFSFVLFCNIDFDFQKK